MSGVKHRHSNVVMKQLTEMFEHRDRIPKSEIRSKLAMYSWKVVNDGILYMVRNGTILDNKDGFLAINRQVL